MVQNHGSSESFVPPLPTILAFSDPTHTKLIAQGAEALLYQTPAPFPLPLPLAPATTTQHQPPLGPPGLMCALKHRPRKAYRHAILDARLTRQRILAEARVLSRCRRDGVPVPAVYALDEDAGWLAMEWVEGEPVRARLNRWIVGMMARGEVCGGNSDGKDITGGRDVVEKEEEEEEEEEEKKKKKKKNNNINNNTMSNQISKNKPNSIEVEVTGGKVNERCREVHAFDEQGAVSRLLTTRPHLVALMERIGRVLGKLHTAGIVHGDLTTSNLMLRPEPSVGSLGKQDAETQTSGSRQETQDNQELDILLKGEVVVIDFGLASRATQEEDRAVDLYVLERAFASTHPQIDGMFDTLLKGYKEVFKQAPSVLRKLDEVRMRGRKRTMVG